MFPLRIDAIGGAGAVLDGAGGDESGVSARVAMCIGSAASDGRRECSMIARAAPPQDVHWPAGTVFTIGHSTLPIERFIATLRTYGIERLVDIRTVPRSRHNPQFNADALAASLAAERIDYVPAHALGGLRRPRKDSPNTGWRNDSFRGYADYMQTAEFEDALATLIALGRERRAAIMCAEAVPWRCHRSLVADALDVRGVPAVEILSDTNYRAHKLTPFAQVAGTRITYPPPPDLLAPPA